MEKKKQRNIYLMYGIALLQGMVFYGPVATLYRQAAGISVFQITLIESMSLALCIVLEMPWGIVADRIGYKKTMVFCCMFYVLSKVVFWKADTFGGFLLERLMLSVIMAGLSGCDVSILYLSCRKGQSHKVFGIYNNINTVGLLMAAFLYSLFIGEDYRLAGFLTVVTYGAAAALSLGLTEVKEAPKQREKHEFFHHVLAVIKDVRFSAMLVGMAMLAETNQTVTVFLSQLQYTRSGISPVSMGYIYILVTLSGMAGLWSSGMTRKLGVRKMSALTYAGAALSCFLMAWTNIGILSVICIIGLRVCASLFLPLSQELQNSHVKSSDRATVLSIYAVMMEACGVGTNLAFGSAADKGLPLAMMLGVGLSIAGLVIILPGLGRRESA